MDDDTTDSGSGFKIVIVIFAFLSFAALIVSILYAAKVLPIKKGKAKRRSNSRSAPKISS